MVEKSQTPSHPCSLEQYGAILEVSEAISKHRDLKELLQDLAERLPRVIPFDFIGLVLYIPERNVMKDFILLANAPHDFQGGKEWSLDSHPAGWVWQTQESLIVQEISQESRFREAYTLMQEDGVASMCLAPLTTPLRPLGALACGSRQKRRYDDVNAAFLCQVARQVAVAVDNVFNYQDLARERDRLRLLLDVNNAVVSHLDPRDVLKAMSDSLRKVIRKDYVSIALYEPAQRQFRQYALDFPSGKGLIQEGLVAPVEDLPAGLALETKKPALFDERDLKKLTSTIAQMLLVEEIKSVCCVPLLFHDRVLGTLNIASREPSAFTDDDVELLTQVAKQIAIAVDNARVYNEIRELKNQLEKEKLYLEEEIRTDHNFEEIIGESPSLKRVLKQVEIVAPTDSSVLILGETGTGKELIARALHHLSGRGERAFVKLNCAAIPTGLLESELFGHEKGAFTGAIAQKIGRFELAHRGTIFLDEIGEIPLDLQSKLLRVLQEHEFERLGGTRTIRVDVRLVAATNRDLAKMVAANQFRSDLFYRLNVFPITVPALRQRREDVPVLVRYFAQRYARRMKKTIEHISTKTLDVLSRYSWPGNVRELENLIERAVILSQKTELMVPLAELKMGPLLDTQPITKLESAEREHILRALRETKWVIGGSVGAAARLGMKRTTLISKMRKLGISRPS